MTESNKIRFTENKKERVLSGIITFLISALLLFFILTYKTVFTTITPPSYIDILFEMEDDLGANYGTDAVGLGEEEPIEQDVLSGAGGGALIENPESAASSAADQKENSSYLTDTDSKEKTSIAPKKTTPKKTNTKTTSNTAKNTPKTSNTPPGAGVGNAGGNAKGNAAVGALISGKGKSTTSTGEGTGGRPGQNQGVETGGEGSGGEGIGNGRKLIGFIPGTMGRGGKVPEHDCTESGSITFSYTVDKNGNITSVNRKSGVRSACLVNTGIKWIKQYVKADKGTQSVSGVYRINF
ncbi:MAG: ferric siderophore ABC transporter substrate-binding protein [Flavobacteriaceae bacterium]|nr:ferric siderophore ABC transporter substrate-binding protein [Flavobacteriaceae bacterium]